MINIKNRKAEVNSNVPSDAKSNVSGSTSQSSSFDVRDAFPYEDILNPEYRQSSEAVEASDIIKSSAMEHNQEPKNTKFSSEIKRNNSWSENRSWESESICSSTSSTISRKQVNGRTKRMNLIKTSGKNFGGQEQWKSPAERVKLLKKKSLAFRFTQAINGTPSVQKSTAKSNDNNIVAARGAAENKKEGVNKSASIDAITQDGPKEPTFTGPTMRATRNRPATPYAKPKKSHPEEQCKDTSLSTISTKSPKYALGDTDISVGDTKKDSNVSRLTTISSSQDTKGPSLKSHSTNAMLATFPFSQDSSFSSNINSLRVGGQGRNVHDTKTPNVSSQPIGDTTNTTSRQDKKTATKGISPCGLALSIVGGIGAAVEHCIGGQIQQIQRELERTGSTDTLDTYDTLDTTQQQLLHEVNLLNRMNSWETNGTFNTAGTMNTAYTSATIDTADAPLFAEKASEKNKTVVVDADDENVSSGQAPTPLKPTTTVKHLKKRKKRKKKKREKVVNFQYPPISSMKACPRATSEERKSLFFTESELDVYEYDRKNNICDDVEIVAVEFSDSESSSVGDEKSEITNNSGNTDQAIDETAQPKIIPTLREGKYSKKFFDHSQTTCSGSPSAHESSQADLNHPRRSALSSKTKDPSAVSGNSGKIKGVQIYLRQRSVV